jgi:hypothetical protein
MIENNPSTSKPKTKYRVRNWSEYNTSLVQRGSITLWISEEVIETWKPAPTGKRGGQYDYSDLAIECLLILKSVYRLTLRATEGFARSLFDLMKLSLEVPNYSTLSRRGSSLEVSLPRQTKEPLHLVVDSTGLKVYGEGEWKVRQHGYSKRRTWRKLHLAIDEKSGEIQAVVLSGADVDDAGVVKELLDEVEAPIEQFSGDGAYDKRKVYGHCQDHEVGKVSIPPRKDAAFWEEDGMQNTPHPRNENLERIQQIGRQEWKQESGYHRRSLAETGMFRFKTIFGNQLQARSDAQQITEVRIKVAALNRMTHLGMPDSYPVIG